MISGTILSLVTYGLLSCISKFERDIHYLPFIARGLKVAVISRAMLVSVVDKKQTTLDLALSTAPELLAEIQDNITSVYQAATNLTLEGVVTTLVVDDPYPCLRFIYKWMMIIGVSMVFFSFCQLFSS